MASATVTGNPEPPPSRSNLDRRRSTWVPGSRLGRLIVLLNLMGLAVLIAGSLVLNEMRRGLVQARLDSLSLQGDLISNVIQQNVAATGPAPSLDPVRAEDVLSRLNIPNTERARLYAPNGRLLADTQREAPPPDGKPAAPESHGILGALDPNATKRRIAAAREALAKEVAGAMTGKPVRNLRVNARGQRMVSVSVPISRQGQVLAVLTLQSGSVDSIIARERQALAPFAVIAIGVSLFSSLLMTQLVALPVLRLARAADRVRMSRARAIALPDLARRDDELGDLTRSLQAMTRALSERMDHIERFAADVSHELRNPMTSIRSAIETLELIKDEEKRLRLINILKHDVERLDRLISDISKSSRLDAELSRDTPQPMNLARQLHEICDFYVATSKADDTPVRFLAAGEAGCDVVGREGPLGQVFRNLIDNAKSFSPPGGEVRVRVTAAREEVRIQVEDDGPGIPPDNIETIFERFYTSRPKGAKFGGNSGLGLAIARQIVETHGGRIWAENRLEDGEIRGARFHVVLPSA